MSRSHHCPLLAVLVLSAPLPSCGGDPKAERLAPGAAAPGSDAPVATSPDIPITGTFSLAWEDNFDSFDAARWQLMTHTWDSNLAQFSTANTRFEDGIASLLLTAEPTDTLKPFRGVEMRSRETS